MEKYLKERISYLRTVELNYHKMQYEYPPGNPLRVLYREYSNAFNARRNECEAILQVLNDSTTEGN